MQARVGKHSTAVNTVCTAQHRVRVVNGIKLVKMIYLGLLLILKFLTTDFPCWLQDGALKENIPSKVSSPSDINSSSEQIFNTFTSISVTAI